MQMCQTASCSGKGVKSTHFRSAVQKDSNFYKEYVSTLEKERFALLRIFALKVSQEVRTYPPNLPRPSF